MNYHSLYDAIIISIWDDKTKVQFIGRIVIPLSMILGSSNLIKNKVIISNWFPLLTKTGQLTNNGSIYIELSIKRLLKKIN